MPRKLSTECPICMDELVLSSLATLVTCGHVFCYDCIRRYLNGHRNNRHPKCPMCRVPIHRGDQPLKLFMGGGSTSSSSPGSSSRADSDTNASLRALRKEHEALKSSSCAQIQDLTRRNNSLSAARVQLENELSEAYRISSTSVKSSRQTIRALAGAADSAWSEVDTLKMENTRLVAEVERLTDYKQRSEILLKQSQDTLESTRQLAYTRIQHLTNEHATKLSDQKFETDKLIRDANRRVLDKSMECRTLSQRIQGVQEAAQAQISGMRNELAQAKMMTEQFSTRDWDLAQSSAHLTNTPAHAMRERDQYVATEEARSTEYREVWEQREALARGRDSLLGERAMFLKAGVELEERVPVLSQELHAITAQSSVNHVAMSSGAARESGFPNRPVQNITPSVHQAQGGQNVDQILMLPFGPARHSV